VTRSSHLIYLLKTLFTQKIRSLVTAVGKGEEEKRPDINGKSSVLKSKIIRQHPHRQGRKLPDFQRHLLSELGFKIKFVSLRIPLPRPLKDSPLYLASTPTSCVLHCTVFYCMALYTCIPFPCLVLFQTASLQLLHVHKKKKCYGYVLAFGILHAAAAAAAAAATTAAAVRFVGGCERTAASSLLSHPLKKLCILFACR
jgi:hypothetical protein